MRYLFPVLVLSCLSGCGTKDADAEPGEVSVSETQALEEAATMLDQQRLRPGPVEISKKAAAAPAASPSPST
jgi:hypothetical protein